MESGALEVLLKERLGMADQAACEAANAIRASMYPAFRWSALKADTKARVVQAYMVSPCTDAVQVPYSAALSASDRTLIKRVVTRGILDGLGQAAAADLRTATTCELDGFLRRTTLTEEGMISTCGRGMNLGPLDSLERAVVNWYDMRVLSRRDDLGVLIVGREMAALGAALPAELAQRILSEAFGVELPLPQPQPQPQTH